jgi:hypothetical protein
VTLGLESRKPLTYIYPVGANKALFDGLRASDLRIWNELDRADDGTPDICQVVAAFSFADAKDLGKCRVWASCDRLLSSHATVEVFQGKGSIILSQFRCSERVNDDPIAARMLLNLVSYAQSAEHPGLIDLCVPVKWGLEAFRTGAFVSTVQGFLPHSKTYKHDGGSKGLLGQDHSIDGFTMVGDYGFTSNGWLRPIPDPNKDGWGILCGTLSRPVSKFSMKLHNVSGEQAKISLKLDSKDVGSPVTVMPNEERTVEWQVSRQAGPVEVELRGDQDLVLTESRFE